MKHMIVGVVCAVVAASSVFAQDAAKKGIGSNITPEQRAKNLARMYARTGGMIRRADALPGEIVFLNAQKTVATEELKKAVENYGRAIRATAKIVERGEVKMAEALKTQPKDGAAIAVLLVDDAEYDVPMFAAPEKGWAVVNVAGLKKDAKSDAFVAARTSKEIIRAALYVCGGANSQYEGSLMRAVKEPKELDDLMNSNAPMDVVGRTMTYLPKFGVSPNPYTTYYMAVQQGWAPPPTNDVQKAIWEKVHAEPSNPIKIKYDPKKGM